MGETNMRMDNICVCVVTIGTIMIIYSVIDIIENVIFMKNC